MSDRPTRRERYERARRRRSIAIATFSTVVVVGALIILIPLTPGWERVRQAFFDGDVFVETFPGLLEAFWLDVQILLWSTPFILIVSLLVAWRATPAALRCSRCGRSP
jgi:polar amino acid transport system permease protein